MHSFLGGRTRYGLVALLAGGALGLAGCGSDSDGGDSATTLDFSTILGPSAQTSQGYQWWADEVEERTDGKVKIRFHYSASLLSGPDTVTGLGDGRTDLAYTVAPYEPVKMALSNVAQIPSEHSQAARVKAYAQLVEEVPELAAELENLNIVPLGVTPVSQTVMASHDPLTVPSDYDGLKVRVAGSPGKIYESVGATNVALPAEEIYQSLERGVIDTVMFPFDNIAANKIYELVDNVTYDGIGAYATSVFAINKDKWDELDEDAREVMAEVTAEYNDGQAMEAVKAADQETCDTLVGEGVTFHVFDEPDWWLEDSQFDPMFQDYVALVEAAGYDAELADEIWAKFMELADAAEAEVDYEDGTQACFEANAE